MRIICPNCKLEFEPKKLKCLRCNHKWQQRGDELPKVCPNLSCKSPYWDRPRIKRLIKTNKRKK